MECPECFNDFDEKGCRPKVLPCGHTFCLKCLRRVDRCYIDQKVFSDIPSELPDNLNLLTLLHSYINSDCRLSVWCLDCQDNAKESCVESRHKILSKKKVLVEQIVEDLAPKLLESCLPQDYQKLVEQLDEDTAAKTLELLSGNSSPLPVGILLQGGGSRWGSSGLDKDDCDEKLSKSVRVLLTLMTLQETIPKEVTMPALKIVNIKPIELTDPACQLDLTNISSCKDLKSVEVEKEQLLCSDQLMKVTCLTGLYCNKDRKWCLKLLQRLAPVLEEVHLYSMYLEHLEVVQSMPNLRWLVLEGLEENMKDKKDCVLPDRVTQSKVEFLWLNLPGSHAEELKKSVLKSYQQSVQVLFAPLDTYHPKAVDFFDGVTLPCLKMLLYATYYKTENCGQVMEGIREKLPNSRVECMFCHRRENFDE